jgi:hypothetical protein
MSTRISDLTIEELMERIRAMVHQAVREALTDYQSTKTMSGQRQPLDLPTFDWGGWDERWTFSREEIYHDDGR